MASQSVWELTFCAAYVVPPCVNVDPEETRRQVSGGVVQVTPKLYALLMPLFAQSREACTIGISFMSEHGKQQNCVWTLIRTLTLAGQTERAQAATDLACRLACVTSKISGHGLLTMLAGVNDERHRVVLWKFPADEAIRATAGDGQMDLDLVEDAFSRKGEYYKSAVFEGTSASTDFWKGRVDDRQARQRQGQVAKFWMGGFLNACPELTSTHGTRLLADALRKRISSADSPGTQHFLIDALQTVKTQADRSISMREFADTFLPVEERDLFLKEAGGPAVADIPFELDLGVLSDRAGIKVLHLDNGFSVRGPIGVFDDVVDMSPQHDDGTVTVTLRGVISSERVLAR